MSKPEHVSAILERIIDRFAEGKDPVTGQLTRDEALDLKSQCVCAKSTEPTATTSDARVSVRSDIALYEKLNRFSKGIQSEEVIVGCRVALEVLLHGR